MNTEIMQIMAEKEYPYVDSSHLTPHDFLQHTKHVSLQRAAFIRGIKFVAMPDGQEGKGLDLEALEIEIDKLLESETEESLNEFLRQRGYLKSPFYCQSDIEDRPICVSQCDHCRVYYKPLESPALPVADGEGEKAIKKRNQEIESNKNEWKPSPKKPR